MIGNPGATQRNLDYLHDRGHRVIPVFTVGATLAEFDALTEAEDYVALGGIARVRNTALRYRYAVSLCQRAAQRGAKVHLLGMVLQRAVLDGGVYSCDEAGTSMRVGFGQLVLFDGARDQRILFREKREVHKHADLLRAYGLEVDRLYRPEALSAGGYRGPLSRAAGMSNVLCAEFWRTQVTVDPPRPGMPPGPRRCSIPDFGAPRFWTDVEEHIDHLQLREKLCLR